MQRNVLEHYLTKVSAGDKRYVDKLCQRLAERLLWVPVYTSEEVTKDGETIQRCELIVIKLGSEPLLPVFTHSSKLKDWLKNTQIKGATLSILGNELCGQLEAGVGLLINDGASNSVELVPEDAWKIAGSALTPGSEDGIEPDLSIGIDTEVEPESHEAELDSEDEEPEMPWEQEIGNRTVEVVVDLKKVQELVRKRMQEESLKADDIQKPSLPEKKVITLYNVVEDDSSGIKN